MTTAIDSGADAATIIGTFEAIIQHHLRDAGDAEMTGIALGFPGPFDYKNGISFIRGLAKYEALYGIDVRKALASSLRLAPEHIRFRNDAEAAAVGEARFGAGKEYARIIGVTLGTGLGSSHVVNGEPRYKGAGIPSEGWLGAVPYQQALADDWFSTRGLFTRFREAGIIIDDLRSALKRAEAGEGAVLRVYEAFGRELGEFLQPYAEAFAAETIIVLGGVSEAFSYFAPPMQRHLPQVQRGSLGANAPLLGAAVLFM